MKNLRDHMKEYLELAKESLREGGQLPNVVLMGNDIKLTVMVLDGVPKTSTPMIIGMAMKHEGATRIIHVAEAWMAVVPQDEMYPGINAEDRDNRKEGIIVSGMDIKEGQEFLYQIIERDNQGEAIYTEAPQWGKNSPPTFFRLFKNIEWSANDQMHH